MTSVWDSTTALSLVDRIELLTHQISTYRSTHLPSVCENSIPLKEKQNEVLNLINKLEHYLLTTGLGNLPISSATVPCFLVDSTEDVSSSSLLSPSSNAAAVMSDDQLDTTSEKSSLQNHQSIDPQHQSGDLVASGGLDQPLRYSDSIPTLDPTYLRVLNDLISLPPAQLLIPPEHASLLHYNNLQRAAEDTGELGPQAEEEPRPAHSDGEMSDTSTALGIDGNNGTTLLASLTQALEQDIALQQSQSPQPHETAAPRPVHFETMLKAHSQALETELHALYQTHHHLRSRKLTNLAQLYQTNQST